MEQASGEGFQVGFVCCLPSDNIAWHFSIIPFFFNLQDLTPTTLSHPRSGLNQILGFSCLSSYTQSYNQNSNPDIDENQ